ncbi:hypothetical protein [Nocardioides ferulae]|uniref:hypothetical protein n=1 Tax=Nocardioides ferulae TaxID=2340821 RepID=UPI000EB4252D|nr:hypothetical protein [Nocardioides ferulae]
MSGVVALGSAPEAGNGLAVVDGGVDAADALARGDWVEAGVDGLRAGLDLAGAVLDPIGTIGSSVAGWLIEHLGPVQGWLDDLCGNPATIAAASATWHAVAEQLTDVGADYQASVRRDFAGQLGLTAVNYQQYSALHAHATARLAAITAGTGAGVAAAGALLAGVRDFISGLLADAVGQVVKLVAESAATLGVAAPHAFATAAAKCREVVAEARRLVESLARSLDRMAELLRRVDEALEAGATLLTRVSSRSELLGGHARSQALDLVVAIADRAGQIDDTTPYAVV